LNLLTKEVQGYKNFLETTNNEWIVKGFIDVNKNVYTITNDTKVVSKIIEHPTQKPLRLLYRIILASKRVFVISVQEILKVLFL
jgi:DNA modification methylase